MAAKAKPKLKSKVSAAANEAKATSGKSIMESAQQIWLAGMGAFAKAQAEGKQVFEALVKEGVSLQKKTQTVAEEKFGEVTSKMTGMADDVTAKAGQHWGKLESIFEERTAKALKKLGVPSSKDVQALQDRIDALTAQMARSKTAAKTAAKKASVKTAAKRAPRKSAAKRAHSAA